MELLQKNRKNWRVNYLEIVNSFFKIGYNGKGIIEVYSKNYKCYDDNTRTKQFLKTILGRSSVKVYNKYKVFMLLVIKIQLYL